MSVGLANISAVVPDIEANKDKVLRAARIFRDCRVNFAVFPEMCLSGYFWEDEPACRRYMTEALIQRHLDWLESELKPRLDDEFIGIVLNGLTAGTGDRFRNRTFILARDHDYLAPENSYDKVFLPGLEKEYTDTGRDDRLVVSGQRGRFGFTTCYDCLFGELVREYCIGEKVDALVEIASWRAAATRDYPGVKRQDRSLLRRPVGFGSRRGSGHESDLGHRL